MAAAATADDTPPPPPVVACSNARMKECLRGNGFDDDLNPNAIRALRRAGGWTVWHYAVEDGRIDVLEWLKAAGMLDMINQPNLGGGTPLHWARAINRAKRRRGGW